MGKVQLVDLSHPFGFGVPLWPYFQDVIIERLHYHQRSGVYTQKITCTMHTSTHADSPAHVFEGGRYTDEIPLESYYGTGVVVDIPNMKEWDVITPEHLEKARPKIEKGDIVIVHTHWHTYYGDNSKYFCRSPGLYDDAGKWFVEKRVKCVGVDQQALDHPLATAIGYHGLGPLRKDICDEYQAKSGKDPKKEFALWEPCHHHLLENDIMGYENVGGDIDKVVGKRVTLAGFPIRWTKGDGSMVRLVAIVDSGDQ